MTIGTRANRPGMRASGTIWGYCYYISAFYPNLLLHAGLAGRKGLGLNQNLTTADHWSTAFNCASFAAGLWNSVCSDHLSAGTPPPPRA